VKGGSWKDGSRTTSLAIFSPALFSFGSGCGHAHLNDEAAFFCVARGDHPTVETDGAFGDGKAYTVTAGGALA